MKPKEFYRRNLPHIQPLGGTFFVTFNLNGSLPKELFLRLKEEFENSKEQISPKKAGTPTYNNLRKKYFYNLDKALEANKNGPHHLKKKEIAEVVANSLQFWDGQTFDLICYCIMSNHVHAVMHLFNSYECKKPIYLQKLLQSIKRHSANKANKILGLNGKFWQRESFDYLIKERDELFRIIEYVLDNPVKAGLCENRKDWAWSYIKPEYNEFL